MDVTTLSQFVPLVEELFYALDALSVSIYDADEQDILEPGVNETPLWDANIVKALFDINQDSSLKDNNPDSSSPDQRASDHKYAAPQSARSTGDASSSNQPLSTPLVSSFCDSLLQKLREAAAPFSELDTLAFRFTAIEDQDWVRKCLDQFKPIAFGSRLRIVPSWENIAATHYIDVRLDPGLAFGTGTHETTFLCLQWLDENLSRPDTVVDLGCGSGILGIAALKLGAKHVYFIDNDPQAITASEQNLKANAIDDKSYTLIDASDAKQTHLMDALHAEPVDLVLANILAKTLLALQDSIAAMTKNDGQVLLSGILSEQADTVVDAYKEYFHDFEIAQKESWVRVSAQRKR